ncbi:MAG: L28 family ribosomal protein [Minisyncoccia bacterium]
MRQCAKCGKGYNSANKRIKLRGKYNPTHSYQQKANLHWTKLYIPGKKVLVCTKCLRTLTKTK